MRLRGSWREAHLLCVDVELTGLDPSADEVIAFGAVPIDGGRIQAAGAVAGMVAPSGRHPSGGSEQIHGILPHDLDGAPPLEQALVPLAAAMTGRTPIAHAAWVEQAFLGPALRRAGGRLPKGIIDTAMLWRLLAVVRERRDPGYRPLREVTDALGLPSHHPHQALGDALTTAQVFLALATRLERLGHGSLRELVHAGHRVATHNHWFRTPS
ncbi:MAG TPA: 3'-5' exonuclease [Gaiellales bacterium]